MADVGGCVRRRPDDGVKIPISVSYVEDGGLEMQFYSSMERLTLAHWTCKTLWNMELVWSNDLELLKTSVWSFRLEDDRIRCGIPVPKLLNLLKHRYFCKSLPGGFVDSFETLVAKGTCRRAKEASSWCTEAAAETPTEAALLLKSQAKTCDTPLVRTPGWAPLTAEPCQRRAAWWRLRLPWASGIASEGAWKGRGYTDNLFWRCSGVVEKGCVKQFLRCLRRVDSCVTVGQQSPLLSCFFHK